MSEQADSGDKPGIVERQSQEFLKRVRKDQRVLRRAERIPGGKWILRFAERAGEGWEPELEPDEQLQMNCPAERLTMLGPTPGRLFLTNRRIIFEPTMQPAWFTLFVRMPRDGLRMTRSGLLSQLLHLRPFIGPGATRGWLHIANVKFSRGRQAAWFRVLDPDDWERAMGHP